MKDTKRRMRRSRWMARISAMAAVATAGSMLQIPSCRGVLTTFNPCGTVFGFCNARDIDALFGDIPDFDLDPTCTIPFFGVDNQGQAGGCATVEVFTTPGPRP